MPPPNPQVLATDISDLTLQLLDRAAEQQGLAAGLELCTLDILDLSNPLPPCDLLLAADCIYNKDLALALASRCAEAWAEGADVILADSQGFHRKDFMWALREQWPAARARAAATWGFDGFGGLDGLYSFGDESNDGSSPPPLQEAKLEGVEGSGLLMDEDLKYDITVRLLRLQGRNSAFNSFL